MWNMKHSNRRLVITKAVSTQWILYSHMIYNYMLLFFSYRVVVNYESVCYLLTDILIATSTQQLHSRSLKFHSNWQKVLFCEKKVNKSILVLKTLLKQPINLNKQKYYTKIRWKVWGDWLLCENKVIESIQELHFRNKMLEISLKNNQKVQRKNYEFPDTYWKLWGKWFLVEIKVTENTLQYYIPVVGEVSLKEAERLKKQKLRCSENLLGVMIFVRKQSNRKCLYLY